MSSGTPTPIAYAKPWLSVADQVRKLEGRGLQVNDRPAAESFLRHVNYYRFAGYCLAFEQPRHQFPAGVTFDQIKHAHNFDVTLRDLFSEALEIIEVDLCTSVAHYFGQKYGPFGHTDPANFHRRFDHKITHRNWLQKLHEEANRSKELFVQHFRRKYTQYPNLPVWAVTEVMTFGAMSRMIRAMHKADRQQIAAQYQVPAKVLFALALHLNYVRNLCAHHSRLWDRKWSIKPELPRQPDWQGANQVPNDRLFSTLLLMRKLMQRSTQVAAEAAQWKVRVEALLDTPPAVADPSTVMGLTNNWKAHPVWA